jgi:hypothetical protein
MQVTARQLNLFKSPRQRGTLPPAPSAFAVQASLVVLIRHTLSPATAALPHCVGGIRWSVPAIAIDPASGTI